jgi:hypothetical protein
MRFGGKEGHEGERQRESRWGTIKHADRGRVCGECGQEIASSLEGPSDRQSAGGGVLELRFKSIGMDGYGGISTDRKYAV